MAQMGPTHPLVKVECRGRTQLKYVCPKFYHQPKTQWSWSMVVAKHQQPFGMLDVSSLNKCWFWTLPTPWPTVGDATSWARQTFVGWGYLSSTLIAFKDLSNEMSQIFRSFPTQNHTIFDEMWFFIRLLGGSNFGAKIHQQYPIPLREIPAHLSHEKKKLLSIESWLFNRDPCNDLWNNPYVYKCRHIL